MPRKRRTRQHVIAELSANYVERAALLAGYSVERIEHDYGIDIILFTYDSNGEVDSGQVFIQLKATDSLPVLADSETIAFPVQRADLERWLTEPMPCILIVYDARGDEAYWMYLQAYVQSRTNFDLSQIGETITVHLTKQNKVDEQAMHQFARFRDAVVKQVQGVIRYYV